MFLTFFAQLFVLAQPERTIFSDKLGFVIEPIEARLVSGQSKLQIKKALKIPKYNLLDNCNYSSQSNDFIRKEVDRRGISIHSMSQQEHKSKKKQT